MSTVYPTRVSRGEAPLARREPVVWRPWHRDAPIDAAQQRHYVECGYLVLEDLFDADEVALLRAEASRLLGEPRGLDPTTLIREPGGAALRTVFAVHWQSPVFASLCADARLYDIARWLLDDEVYVHQSRLNHKPGFDGQPFYWHSDFETWHAEDGMPRMRSLSVSLLLEENTSCNGPLMVIPRSHLHFVPCVGATPVEHYRESLRAQRYGVPDEASLTRFTSAHGIVPLIGKSGTVIVFDCNLLHGSTGNITPLPRSNLFVVFNAVSNKLRSPLYAHAPRPEFLAARRDALPLRRRVGPLRA